MAILLTILWQVMLPVFLIIALGYLLERWLSLDVRPISRVIFYVLAPCLVFPPPPYRTLLKAGLRNLDSVR